MGMLRVKATTAVAGMWAGEEYDVQETDFIQLLLSVQHLVLIKDYDAEAETLPDPEPEIEEPSGPPISVWIGEGGAAGEGDNPGQPGSPTVVEVSQPDDTATPLGEKDYVPE